MKKELISELDKEIIRQTGYGARRGFGKKPAVIVIDAHKKFVGLDLPILESMKTYPLSIGEKACRTVEKIKLLLDAARNKRIPVFYSISDVPVSEMLFNSFARKRISHEKSANIPSDQNNIVDLIRPVEGEGIIHKRYASAFFGTPLMTFLNTLGCDTLIVTGFVTSGCVRAFVVDAASYNFNVIVAEDCVQDRFEFAHELSLIDIDLKYGDVLYSEEVLNYFRGI